MADHVIGLFDVSTDEATLDKARALTCLSGADAYPPARGMPTMLPIIWLNQTGIREELDKIGSHSRVLVHVKQDITYTSMPAPNRAYRMSVAISDMDAEGVVLVTACVRDQGSVMVELRVHLASFALGDDR